MKRIKQHILLARIIATLVVCLFTINTVLWAYPDAGGVHKNFSTLQVMSFFEGFDELKQTKLEKAFIFASIIKASKKGEVMPFQDINGLLDEWYSDDPMFRSLSRRPRRVFNVERNPEVSDGKISVTVSHIRDPKKRKIITLEADDLFDKKLWELVDEESAFTSRYEIDWPEMPDGENKSPLKKASDHMRFIKNVIDRIVDIEPDIFVWQEARDEKSGNEKASAVNLFEWLWHRSFGKPKDRLSFAGMAVTFTGLSYIGNISDSEEKDLSRYYSEYRIKLDEILMLFEQIEEEAKDLDQLPDVNWTEDNPATHNESIQYLLKYFLCEDREERMQALEDAAVLIRKASEEMDEFLKGVLPGAEKVKDLASKEKKEEDEDGTPPAAKSKMTNIYKEGRFSWLKNLPLRILGLVSLATPIHEFGHLIWAMLSGQRHFVYKAYKRSAAQEISEETEKETGGLFMTRPKDLERLALNRPALRFEIYKRMARIFLSDVFFKGEVKGVSEKAARYGGVLANTIAGFLGPFVMMGVLCLFGDAFLNMPSGLASFIGVTMICMPFWSSLLWIVAEMHEGGDLKNRKKEPLFYINFIGLKTALKMPELTASWSRSINGSISTGRGHNNREILVVDREKDEVYRRFERRFIKKFYLRIIYEAGIPVFLKVVRARIRGGRSEVQLPGRLKGKLARIVFDTVSSMVDYNLNHDRVLTEKCKDKAILIGDAAIYPGKGVCRHQGIIVAALLEQLIKEGYLHGRVRYVRGYGHGWAEYRDSAGNIHVFDVAKGYLGPKIGEYESYDSIQDEEKEERNLTMDHAVTISRVNQFHLFAGLETPIGEAGVVDEETGSMIIRPKVRVGLFERLILILTSKGSFNSREATLKRQTTAFQDFSGKILVSAGRGFYSFWAEGEEVKMAQVSFGRKVSEEVSFPLDREYRVGRSRTNDYVNEKDDYLSGKHFSIKVKKDASGRLKFRVTDAGSNNGTTVIWIIPEEEDLESERAREEEKPSPEDREESAQIRAEETSRDEEESEGDVSTWGGIESKEEFLVKSIDLKAKSKPKPRVLMKRIASTHRKSERVFKMLGSYLSREELPVDITVDLSLIHRKDLDENIETWAHLILMARDLENVNFVFENLYIEEGMPEELKSDIHNSVPEKEAMVLLKDKITDLAMAKGMESEAAEKVIKRIASSVRKGAIEISLSSKTYFQWLASVKEPGKELQPNQYPVALEGATAIKSEEAPLRNFEAALIIALTKASLVIAHKKDELDEVLREERLLTRLNELYSEIPFENDVILTKDTITKYMISSSAATRINLAISLALPPMTRDAIKKLQELHDAFQMTLLAA